MPRRRIGEFHLGEPIGVGTVGTIYRARDLTREQDVALKILLPAVSKEPLILARFEREMVVLEKLSHPNIVRYYGGGRADEQLFFAMELMTGGSLKDELARSGPLNYLEAVTCGIQISSALQHAHNHGVIHRDLKPSNLLFNQEGHLKLVDFGIARDTHGADITANGLTVGSHAYMAPEQIVGKRDITGHVDLYAFGCLLHEMLVGHPPYQGENFAQLFEQHLHAEPPSVRTRFPDVPSELDSLVKQLLEKSPEKRPFSARAVQGRLLEIADKELSEAERVRDVSASDVIDRGRHSISRRIQAAERDVSWPTLIGVFLLAVAAICAAWALGL